MARPGPKPRPRLAVIREGNPGHQKLSEDQGVVFPPTAPQEPDWALLLTGDEFAQKAAAELWSRLASSLARSVGLVDQQRDLLIDYCVTVARIRQGERAMSMEGPVVTSTRADRGTVRHPWASLLNQYRTHYRSLLGELGLSPSAASRLTRPATEDDDDPFD